MTITFIDLLCVQTFVKDLHALVLSILTMGDFIFERNKALKG